MHSDFVAAATRGAMAVVDGNVMAINPGEEPKMQMFIWNNIFFSLGFDVRDHYKDLGGDAAAFVAPVRNHWEIVNSSCNSIFKLQHNLANAKTLDRQDSRYNYFLIAFTKVICYHLIFIYSHERENVPNEKRYMVMSYSFMSSSQNYIILLVTLNKAWEKTLRFAIFLL